MFLSAISFDQPLNSWDVSNVTQMGAMFAGAISFDQPLNSWNVSSVTDMSNMFQGAVSFNQPLDNWDVLNTLKVGMFNGATLFNQNIGSWNMSGDTSLVLMLDDSGLSQENYDNLLIGWSGQTLQTLVEIGVNNLVYSETPCPGGNARGYIVFTRNWFFVGDSAGTC
jgi:surface protein